MSFLVLLDLLEAGDSEADDGDLLLLPRLLDWVILDENRLRLMRSDDAWLDLTDDFVRAGCARRRMATESPSE